MRKLAIWILAIILLAATVNALGVTPGRTNINFEPNSEKEVVFTVTNSQRENLNVVVTLEGELSKYIEINETRFSLAADESGRLISYKIKLPDKLDPGLKKANIVLSQVLNSLSG